MIDFHTHIGRINYYLKPLTADALVSKMDELGIEKSVVLPIENPEDFEGLHEAFPEDLRVFTEQNETRKELDQFIDKKIRSIFGL